MLGAAALDASVLKGRTMLNLDSEDEGVLTVAAPAATCPCARCRSRTRRFPARR